MGSEQLDRNRKPKDRAAVGQFYRAAGKSSSNWKEIVSLRWMGTDQDRDRLIDGQRGVGSWTRTTVKYSEL